MESAAMTAGTLHILRVDPGEDVLQSIRKCVERSGIRQAVILGGYGTLAAHHLHWVTHNRIPADNAFARGEGGIEILSMNGLVVEGEPHVHVTLSTQEGAYGGHMEEGCIAYVLCEIYMTEVEGATLSRENTHVNIENMGRGDVPRLTFS